MIFEEFVVMGLVGCAVLFCVFLQMGYIDSLYYMFGCRHEWEYPDSVVLSCRECKICGKEQYGHDVYEQWIDYN